MVLLDHEIMQIMKNSLPSFHNFSIFLLLSPYTQQSHHQEGCYATINLCSCQKLYLTMAFGAFYLEIGCYLDYVPTTLNTLHAGHIQIYRDTQLFHCFFQQLLYRWLYTRLIDSSNSVFTSSCFLVLLVSYFEGAHSHTRLLFSGCVASSSLMILFLNLCNSCVKITWFSFAPVVLYPSLSES